MNPRYKLSSYSYIGMGLLIGFFYGLDRFGWQDYRVIGLGILIACLLLIDPLKYYKRHKY